MGSIHRIDYYVYAFLYTDAELSKTVKNVVLIDYIVSSVVTANISMNTIRSIVEISYQGNSLELKK